MRIVHIDETFHPSYGYQVNPLAKFQSMAGNEVFIVTVEKAKLHTVYKEFGETGEHIEESDNAYMEASGVSIIRVPVHRYVSNRAIYYNELFKVVDQIYPDVLFVHLFESYAALRYLLGKKKYPMIFDSHMLAMASKNRFSWVFETFYKTIIARIVRKNQFKVIRTQDDDYVITHLGVPAEMSPFISFGSDTSIFHPSPTFRKSFREKHDINDDDFVIIYTGKLTADKGALFLADAIKDSLILPNGRTVVFVIVGNAIGEYGHTVELRLRESENRILRFPAQNYVELPQFYQMADVSIFPKQCSLSFYDAQACGLPVIAEDNNINIDRLHHDNGVTFKKENILDLRSKILYLAEMEGTHYRKLSEGAYNYVKAEYDYSGIADQYTEKLAEELANFRRKIGH